jgi:hypothetical protein
MIPISPAEAPKPYLRRWSIFATGIVTIWKGRTVCVDSGTEKREGERLEIYKGGISPCSNDRVSDL